MAAAKLVTRCPACRTAFRLVADQLRLREGLVRCGRCDTVFDARRHLIEVPVPAASPAAAEHAGAVAPSGTAAGTRGLTAAPDQAYARTAPQMPPADDEPEETPRTAPPFDPGYDPGYDVPALDAPTMMMGAPGTTTEVVPEAGSETTAETTAEAASEAASEAAPDTPAAAVAAPAAEDAEDAEEAADRTDAATMAREVHMPTTSATHAAISPAAPTAPAWPAIESGALDDPARTSSRAGAQAPSAATAGIEVTLPPGAPAQATPTAGAEAAPAGNPATRGAGGYLRNESTPDAIDGSPTAIAREQTTRRWTRQDEPPAAVFAPDFLRHARTREAPPARRAGKRAWLVAGAALLGLAAAAQVAYLARSQLAGHFPVLRPVLESACVPLGCTVPPWRDLDALRIDTSQLQKQDEGGDAYLLSVTLRNQGRTTTALPAIELVTTDMQDQLLLRRVLQPAEYLSPAQRAFAVYGMRAGTELAVRVRFRTQQAPANYRVLLFYP